MLKSTKTKPFELVLSCLTTNFTFHRYLRDRLARHVRFLTSFLKPLDIVIQQACSELEATQRRFKRNLDKRLRSDNRRLRGRDYVYIDPSNGSRNLSKLESSAQRPRRVISADRRAIYIERERLVQRVPAHRPVYSPPMAETHTAPDARELQPTESGNHN